MKIWYAYDDASTIMSSVDDQKPNHYQTINPHCKVMSNQAIDIDFYNFLPV